MPKCYSCKKEFDKPIDGKCSNCGNYITKSGKAKPLCPGCGKPVYRQRHGRCPNCNEEIVLVRERDNKFFVNKYKLKSQVGKPISQIEQLNQIQEPVKLPELTPLFNTVDRLDETHWQVNFRTHIERVVCPNCRKLQFVNRMSYNAKIERICKCKHHTIYIFDFLK